MFSFWRNRSKQHKAPPPPSRHNPFRARLSLEQFEDRVNPTPVIAATALSNAPEGSSGYRFQLARDDTSGFLTVNLSFSGTADSGDFTNPMFASFMNGQATTDVYLNTTDDSTSEPTETLILTIASGTGYTIGSPASATINILDNDAQVVTVEAVQGAEEGGQDGIVRFTRIGDLSASLTANFTVGGTATSGTDYTSIGTTVAFSAGSATAEKTVATIDDNIPDVAETVEVTVTSGSGYSVGTQDEDGTSILDSVDVTFTLNSYSAAVKYEVPWGDVDAEEATQELTPTSFNLNIGGQNFAYGTANYSVAPTLHFEYGELVGIEFGLNLAGTGSAFSSIAASSGVASGVDAATQQVYADNPCNPMNASLALDFSTITIPATGEQEFSLRLTTVDPLLPQGNAKVKVTAGMTKAQVRDAFAAAIRKEGFITAGPSGSEELIIKWHNKGLVNTHLKKVESFNFGQTGAHPKLIGTEKGPNGVAPTYHTSG